MSRAFTRAGVVRRRRWVLGALLAALLLPLALAGTASAADFARTYTNSESIAIPDRGPGTPFPSTLDVSGIASTVTDVNVVLYGVQHTWLGDLNVWVTGPQGQSVPLMSRVPTSEDGNDADITFDDSATAYITSGLVNGAVYRPSPSGSLSAFSGVDPNGPWRLYVQDEAYGDHGAIARGWSVVITVDDVTAPVTTIDLSPAANAAGWNNSDVTATLSATDAEAGVAGSEFRLAGETIWTPYPPFVIDTEGETTWEYRSIDTVGNTETEQSVTVRLDKTPPVTTATGLDGLWHSTPVTVELSAEDQAGLSGVAGTEYSLDGASYVAGTSLTIDTEGSHTVDYRSTDFADNVETAKSGSVGYDATGPATTDDAPAGWQTTAPVTVTLKPDDGSGCGMTGGVAKTEYKIDGASSWSEGTSVAVAGDGIHTVTYRSTDALGNVGAEGGCTVKIDAAAPTIAVSGSDAAWHTAPVTLTFTPAAGVSGVASVEYRLGDGAWTELAQTGGAYAVKVSAKGKTVVRYRATSVAGLKSAVGSCTVKIDGGAPTLRLATRTLRIWTRSGENQRLKLRWNDGDSTRARLRVRVTQYGTMRQKDFSFSIGRRSGQWQIISLPWRPHTPGRYALHLALYDQAGRRCDATTTVVAYR